MLLNIKGLTLLPDKTISVVHAQGKQKLCAASLALYVLLAVTSDIANPTLVK